MTSDDAWLPAQAPTGEVRLKWAYNGETGDVALWEVGGPGDGFPTHQEHLARAWGREARPAAGDILGNVTYRGETLRIGTYYGASAPSALVDLLRDRFPDTSIAS